jgi:hypothetical protein
VKRKKPETYFEKRARINRVLEARETRKWIKEVQTPLLEKNSQWQICLHGKRKYRCDVCHVT